MRKHLISSLGLLPDRNIVLLDNFAILNKYNSTHRSLVGIVEATPW